MLLDGQWKSRYGIPFRTVPLRALMWSAYNAYLHSWCLLPWKNVCDENSKLTVDGAMNVAGSRYN